MLYIVKDIRPHKKCIVFITTRGKVKASQSLMVIATMYHGHFKTCIFFFEKQC